jgi:hypothetical protein
LKKNFLIGILIAFVLFLVIGALNASAQLTVLNVPSADITAKGQVYFRGDTTYQGSTALTTFTPNLMFGIGSGAEFSLNAESLSHPGFGAISVVPGIKYRFFNIGERFVAYAGDKIYLPVHNKTFGGGNYTYGAFAYSTTFGTRVGVGWYNQQNAYAEGNRSGGLFTLEQNVWINAKKRTLATLAADWQTGRGTNGVATFGVMFFPTERLMVIPSYQLFNTLAMQGNNQAVMYIGYLLKK